MRQNTKCPKIRKILDKAKIYRTFHPPHKILKKKFELLMSY